MLIFSMFRFTDLWSPIIIAVVVLLFALSFFWIKVRQERICFWIALALFYLAVGSPLDLLGHISFMFHMIQMTVLFLMIPPFLWHGLPIRWVAKIVTSRLFLFFSRPVLALVLFNGFFSLYHVPLVFDAIKVNALYHTLMTAFLFVLASLMWWHIFDRYDNGRNMAGIRKIGYIFMNGILLTPTCILIILAKQPMYATYSDPTVWMKAMSLCVPSGTLQNLNINSPQIFLSMPIIQDQQNGGVLMKIIQEIVYGVFLFIAFFKWVKVERMKDEAETKEFFEQVGVK